MRHCILLGLLLISGFTNKTIAQPEVTAVEARLLTEKIILVTDRDIYAVDEDILFSAFNMASAQMRKIKWSNVLYVELISPDGTPVLQEKYAWGENGADGKFRIPNWVLTGNYFIRAYTRWMRNYSPNNYQYKMVSIVNPFRPELLEPGTEQTIAENNMHVSDEKVTNDIQLKTDKRVFRKHEIVDLELTLNNTGNFQNKLVVSVIPKGSEFIGNPNFERAESTAFSPKFIPETRGVSLSGKLINRNDSLPLSSTLVGLTVFSDPPENLNILTNEKGLFFFDLADRKGEYEVFISAKPNVTVQSPLILVDNDFSSENINVPFVPMSFSDEAKALYKRMIFTSQMQAFYRDQTDSAKSKLFSTDRIFYGKPEFVLQLKDYISLPSVTDYFYELIPKARVREEGGKRILKVVNRFGELESYDPLILLDMVSIFDVDKVLDLQPEKLDRIEILTNPFIRGDITYGGIISFFSKKHDLAGVDLPSAGMFLSFKLLSNDLKETLPVKENQRVPDLRNCLYWNPCLEIKGNEPRKISFPVGDNSGEYVIVVKGVDNSGKLKATTLEMRIE